MKKTLLIVLPLLLIVGCSSPEPINYEETLNERDGVFYTKDTNKPYSGPVFSLDKNGNNKRESILEDGKMIIYKDIEWHSNRQKKSEETFKDGKQDGLVTTWHENGRKKSEGTMKDGKQDGLWIHWYENGQKSRERTYKDGVPDGLWIYYSNGSVDEEGTYKDGKKDGKWTEWHSNGQKWKERTFKNGKLDGKSTWWYKNGQKKWEGTYDDDGQLISAECWDEDGNECECSEDWWEGCK